jgi:CheY-like chemotaxis protein
VPSVFVVEDDADASEVLVTLLRRAGYDVAVAPDGREALGKIGDVMPDVVLLDLMMPQMDGMHFLGVLRCYHRWQHVPVVVLTAAPVDQRLRDRLEEFEVKDIFRKADHRLDDLLSCVNERAGSSSASDPRDYA